MNTAANPIPAAETDQDAAAVAVLRDLCRPLQGGAALRPQCIVVQPNEIPQPMDALLVHHEHMTEVLERRYGRYVDVQVHDQHHDPNVYTRNVSLTPAGGGPVVEWGIVRIDFRFMTEQVRDEILAGQTPLGAILIRHDVHRRVKPRWFMRFPERGPMLTFFGDASDRPLYGRIGTIYCDDAPAIDLLEIVTGAPVPDAPEETQRS